MRQAIRRYLKDFIAIVVLVAIAAGVGGYILAHQRFSLPSWVPLVGEDSYTVKAEFQTAQSITPGQGQTVNIAGVKVGEIAGVDLVDGRAIVTMKLMSKYAPIYRDATMLLRPKTGLNDMLIALDPGTPAAGKLPDGATLPIQNTLPNVNVDEILSALDADSRTYLKLLLGGAGEGLRGQGRQLSATLRRSEPTSRDLLAVTEQLAQRRENLRQVVHNLQLLSNELADKDVQITRFIRSTNTVMATLARQDAQIRTSLKLLPGTLRKTDRALKQIDSFASELGPAAKQLRPGARALKGSLEETQSFLRTSTPVIKDQLRPFARAALPTLELLTPAAVDLAALTPDLQSAFEVMNYTFNALANNPQGTAEEGYLFWLSWANHTIASSFNLSDAHGPLRRGLLMTTCDSLGILQSVRAANQVLDLIIQMVNVPTQGQVCS